MLPVDAVNITAKCQEWVKTINKKSLALPTPHYLTGVFAQFSQCSPLPLIKLHIQDATVTCICDTGASKSLMSDTLAIYLYGVEVLTSLHTNLNCCLKDVQNKEIPVLGSLMSTFQINDFTFNHKFIIFQTTTHEILLGYEFFKQNKIALLPNSGLAWEPSSINKIGLLDKDIILPIYILHDISLQPACQQVVSVCLIIKQDDSSS